MPYPWSTGDTITAARLNLDDLCNQAPFSAGTLSLDLGAYRNFDFKLTANVTTTALSNVPPSGRQILMTIRTKGNGSAWTWAWFTSTVKWDGGVAPTITSANGKYDLYTFISLDGGTTWGGSVVSQNRDA